MDCNSLNIDILQCPMKFIDIRALGAYLTLCLVDAFLQILIL